MSDRVEAYLRKIALRDEAWENHAHAAEAKLGHDLDNLWKAMSAEERVIAQKRSLVMYEHKPR